MVELTRAFIAFDIDDDEILRGLLKVQSQLSQCGADLRMVKSPNIHITMRFLGDIRPDIVDKISGEMEKLDFSPFEVKIQGIGAFPTHRYARIVWAGIKDGSQTLAGIFKQLESLLLKFGFKPDVKGFSPHITIARVRTGRNKGELIRCLREFEEFDFGVLKLECLKLKKSVLTPRGPLYSTLKEVRR